jgi:hypothetical protein
LPDALRAALARVRARLRLRAGAHAVTVGGAVFGALAIAVAPTPASSAIAVTIAAVLIARQWRADDMTIARAIESRQPLDNLLVTAAEIAQQRSRVHPEIGAAIQQQAADRAAMVDAKGVVPLLQPMAAAAAIVIGCALLAARDQVPGLMQSFTPFNAANGLPAVDPITVTVSPPAYTKRAAETHANPTQLTVIAGSRVRIETQATLLREWAALASESLELRATDDAPSRFLAITVIPDAPPSVRIPEPGRDAAFASPRGSVRLAVEARDDLGLAALAVRYTKASGGGENVTFTEGEVPLTIERVDERNWRARAQWPLDGLGLADGDVLVYRAVVRDGNPTGAAVESDAFLIEIGRAAEIASAGFALPTEERKYAISQQMVIYKTEQLLANRAKHPTDWLEQTRLIGIEQRMVRAEVVFLSGGEVQDEVEEAAHSHELAEGRLENPGRAEMVRALNFMSRAEAQLNDGNAVDALVFERQALASLERALDRRRYFLRTLPDRSRIDPSRRLTGERREARSWLRDRHRAEAGPLDRLQAAMRELMAAAGDPTRANASLAARVAAVQPGHAPLQQAAVAIANAQSDAQRRDAVQAAMQALTSYALTTLPGSAPVFLPADPLAGRLGEAMRPR